MVVVAEMRDSRTVFCGIDECADNYHYNYFLLTFDEMLRFSRQNIEAG